MLSWGGFVYRTNKLDVFKKLIMFLHVIKEYQLSDDFEIYTHGCLMRFDDKVNHPLTGMHNNEYSGRRN